MGCIKHVIIFLKIVGSQRRVLSKAATWQICALKSSLWLQCGGKSRRRLLSENLSMQNLTQAKDQSDVNSGYISENWK